jgi:hypothetical protein
LAAKLMRVLSPEAMEGSADSVDTVDVSGKNSSVVPLMRSSLPLVLLSARAGSISSVISVCHSRLAV